MRIQPIACRIALASLCLFAVNSKASAQSHISVTSDCDCAGDDYAGNGAERGSLPPHIHVEYGKRRPIIDGVGWIVGVPSKLLLWDRRSKNHSVSDTTVAEVTHYMQHRELGDTVVRVNQYAPVKEWRRLVQNKEVGAGWRYTVGSLKWLQYTLLPGRIFGSDEYNPYSNSLYLYSDMPMLGLAEAAYAYDVRGQAHPGTYATLQTLPIVAMWHEAKATHEVLNYVSDHGSSESSSDVRDDLYARYGISLGGEVSRVVPNGGGLFEAVGAIAGHGMAR